MAPGVTPGGPARAGREPVTSPDDLYRFAACCFGMADGTGTDDRGNAPAGAPGNAPENAPENKASGNRPEGGTARAAGLGNRLAGHPEPPAVGRAVGIETEWLVVDLARPARRVPPAETLAALTSLDGWLDGWAGRPGVPADRLTDQAELPPLPGGSRVTFEPGGQFELSGPPRPLAAAVSALASDLALARAALHRAGLGLAGLGVDPLRPPGLVTTASRYTAMAEHFRSRCCHEGWTMMCSTASVQVNLDVGGGPQAGAAAAGAQPAAGTASTAVATRFRLAHALGPVLTAMFAASPVAAGRRTCWRSVRQTMWAEIDPTRTRAVLPLLPGTAEENWLAGRQAGQGPGGPCVADADLPGLWASYLRDAHMMMVADEGGRYLPVRGRVTFGDWMAGRGPVPRPPTLADLAWHATTLFPPVRPRGWLELRYLDAQPGDGWQVAVAVATALLDDPAAAEAALAVCLPVAHRWPAATTLGLRDEQLYRAANECADLALAALERSWAASGLCAAVAAFTDRYTRRGRCPADDLVARFTEVGPADLLREEAAQCAPVA